MKDAIIITETINVNEIGVASDVNPAIIEEMKRKLAMSAPKAEKKPKKKKQSNSRSARMGRAVEAIRSNMSAVQSILDEAKSRYDQDETEREDDTGATLTAEEIAKIEDLFCYDLGEVEAIKDEITTWRENIEEKFSQTQKYSDLEECEQTIESAKDELETHQGVGTFDADSYDDIESAISDVESACDELEGVSFPGMFG